MSTEESISERPEQLIGTTIAKYKVLNILGKGSFGICFEGLDTSDNSRVALKVENGGSKQSLVNNELKAHQILNGLEGIPKLLAQGIADNRHIIVMELLGEDLYKIYNRLSKQFSLKTIFMLAEQMIDRTRSVHQKGLIHRDLKPENFLIGLEEKDRNKLFLIDFGLAERYSDETSGQHLPCNEKTSFSGTVRFCSVNSHKGYTMSRRDDLESIVYILLYFIWSTLPWDGLESTKSGHFYNEVKQKKEDIVESESFEQIPEVIRNFLNYCRLLGYEEIPDYNYWMQMFRTQHSVYQFVWDYKYDWI